MATATGATLAIRPTSRSTYSRNLNVVSTTASPAVVGATARTPQSRPQLVAKGSTKSSDYLLVGGLIVALLVLVRKG
jgi:hypothetical protein